MDKSWFSYPRDALFDRDVVFDLRGLDAETSAGVGALAGAMRADAPWRDNWFVLADDAMPIDPNIRNLRRVTVRAGLFVLRGQSKDIGDTADDIVDKRDIRSLWAPMNDSVSSRIHMLLLRPPR